MRAVAATTVDCEPNSERPQCSAISVTNSAAAAASGGGGGAESPTVGLKDVLSEALAGVLD